MLLIKSDFKDFYDTASDTNGNIVYNRFRSKDTSRADELLFLKQNGIKTVEFGPLSKFGPNTPNYIVYTNPSLHSFKGKKICTYNDVIQQYSNYLVAEFIRESGGYTVKYLQVGERRFRITMYNPNFCTTLEEGNILSIDELNKQYNYAIGLPIYSIDYISNGQEMLAIDFNTVQSLSRINFQLVMSPDEICKEIEGALIAYNKA